jgi:hypothetical protein
MPISIEAPEPDAMPAMPLSAADQAGIDWYLQAGERAAVLFDVARKQCVGLMVVTVVSWALGQLPAAIPLF